jgi:hypothetical protein
MVSIGGLRLDCDRDAYPLAGHLESVLNNDEWESQLMFHVTKLGSTDGLDERRG